MLPYKTPLASCTLLRVNPDRLQEREGDQINDRR